MTGLSGRWPIWATRSPIRRSATCCVVTVYPQLPSVSAGRPAAQFIRVHLAVLAGTDFVTVEVLTLRGLVTFYVLLFIHLEGRRVAIAGITDHPNEQWMQQMARNATMEGCGTLRDCRYLLHDRDTKYSAAFRAIIETGHVKTLPLPARSPNLNAYAEQWIRSVKDECLSKIILFGNRSLQRAMSEYVTHYNTERNHQGKSNVLLFPGLIEMSRAKRCAPASDLGFCAITIERPREIGVRAQSSLAR
jgi:putative transposase